MLPLLAHRFGMDRETIVLMLSLAAHESGHLIAAKLVHARVSEIRLTPFGALATVERMHDLSPTRLIAVAAAGPIANLAAVLALCALCQMRWIHPMNAAIGLRINLLLLLFNLLPALPLDGGRIAWALLANRFSRVKALRFLTASGITVAAGLITITLNGWIRLGTLNLSLVFAAVFMLASLAKERDPARQQRGICRSESHEAARRAHARANLPDRRIDKENRAAPNAPNGSSSSLSCP